MSADAAPVAGGVCAPAGFTAAGVAAGIKPGSSKRDCALILSDRDAVVAGAFTTNRFAAPPVLWNRAVCQRGTARGVFVNSGNANACTGEAGFEDTAATARRLAAEAGCADEALCVCSTGVIGVRLPMERLLDGASRCLGALAQGGSPDAAEAIMTTDTVPKERAIEVALSTGAVRIGGIAKGSGMIAPNMATMIALLTTDAAVDQATLAPMVRRAVERSFNRICVDNDMSTSDTVLCLANGAAGQPALTGEDAGAFEAALTMFCQDLARDLVKDGEGASKFVEVRVDGAPDDGAAKTIARAIAQSQLCKTAFFGEDPNWGRIACAAGYAGVPFDPAAASVWLDGVHLMRDGCAADYREEDAAAVMRQPAFTVRVRVGEGAGACVFWTSDLSYDYVRINADYRT